MAEPPRPRPVPPPTKAALAELGSALNPDLEPADAHRTMSALSPFAILVVVAAALLAGLLVAGVMASRVDNAQRLADLVRETRRLRAAHLAAPQPSSRRRR